MQRIPWAIVFGALLVAAPISAQTSHGTALDFTYGTATSWGGAQEYLARATPSWTLTFVPASWGSRFVAFTLGGRPQGSGEAICQPAPDGSGCGPDFPSTTALGIGVGLQRGAPEARGRVILGPMLYLGDLRAGGARLQLDGAGGWRYVQVVVAGRGDLVRRGRETLGLGSVEVGLRLID